VACGTGKALREAGKRGLDGVVSQEAVVARHALALLVGLAMHNAGQLLEQHKELSGLISTAASFYESSGMMSWLSPRENVPQVQHTQNGPACASLDLWASFTPLVNDKMKLDKIFNGVGDFYRVGDWE
jgi:hypothetical protein